MVWPKSKKKKEKKEKEKKEKKERKEVLESEQKLTPGVGGTHLLGKVRSGAIQVNSHLCGFLPVAKCGPCSMHSTTGGKHGKPHRFSALGNKKNKDSEPEK